MNRGRRRGGLGLSGLRDGVKRRLFDPNIVPHKPDARESIGRLAPVISGQLKPCSLLMGSKEASQLEEEFDLAKRKRNADDELTVSYQTELFKLNSVLEFAFEHSPHHYRASLKTEGIQLKQPQKESSSSSCLKVTDPISSVHLLLFHDEIERWSDAALLKGLHNPKEWYPPELIQLMLSTKTQKKKRKVVNLPRRPAIDDRSLDEFVSDHNIAVVSEQAEIGLNAEDERASLQGGSPKVSEDEEENQSEGDAEDARWNGEAGELGPDADDEELDNDYCQAYFDNGEGETSDDGLGGYTVGDDEARGDREGDYYD